MRTPLAVAASAVLLCSGFACLSEEPAKKQGPTHEGVMRELVGNLSAIAEVLSGITDDASAQAALPKLIPLCKQRRDIWKAIKALGNPTPEVEKVLAEKYRPQVQAAMQKLEAETQRLPAVGKALKEARVAAEKDDAPKKAE